MTDAIPGVKNAIAHVKDLTQRMKNALGNREKSPFPPQNRRFGIKNVETPENGSQGPSGRAFMLKKMRFNAKITAELCLLMVLAATTPAR